VAGACWGAYIVLTQRVGDRFSGLDGLAVSMTAAALVAAGPGLPAVVGRINVQVLAISAAVAVLVPVLPYAFETAALRRLTTSSFGTLMSLEPAIGTAVGLVLLAQTPGPGQLVGIALVTLAGIGAANRAGAAGKLADWHEITEDFVECDCAGC
jgi:inner membrane transporter RhtA